MLSYKYELVLYSKGAFIKDVQFLLKVDTSIPMSDVKFTFSEKAPEIDKIFIVNLTVCSNRQIDGEDFVNFCGLLRKHELYYVRLSYLLQNRTSFMDAL